MPKTKVKTYHRCQALGCKAIVKPRMLMCLKHWRQVPNETQKMVWSNYRPGQETDKVLTLSYVVAMLDAIISVADKEGLAYDVNLLIRSLAKRWSRGKTPKEVEVEFQRFKREITKTEPR